MIRPLKPSLRLHSNLLLAFKKWILVVGKTGGLIRKKKPPRLLKKNIRLSRIIVSLPPYQVQAPSLLVKTLVEPEAIVVTKSRVM